MWQIDDGLPQNSVWAITQTHDGYLWVGTQQGLARFDGRGEVHECLGAEDLQRFGHLGAISDVADDQCRARRHGTTPAAREVVVQDDFVSGTQ